jgi:hypothetical protein
MLVANRASTEVIDVFIDLNKGTGYLSSELFPFNMVNAFTGTSKRLRFPLFT